MNESNKNMFKPVNDPIKARSQVSSYIQIPEFDKMVTDGEISIIQVLYERIAQEIYNTRKKNYSWGFRVIEPEFLNYSDHIHLVSKLYEEEHLADLNSVVFKLFAEFNNLILSTALHMHIPIKGIIRLGETYRGTLKSKKPALVSGKDPLILSDLLKVFSIGEIFPNGFSDGLIPAMEMPYHFGASICKSKLELSNLNSVGIFMPADCVKDKTADVTILSNMIAETKINGDKVFACNWKEWMNEQTDCSTENVLAYAESESGNEDSPYAKNWQSLINYATDL